LQLKFDLLSKLKTMMTYTFLFDKKRLLLRSNYQTIKFKENGKLQRTWIGQYQRLIQKGY